MGSDDELVSGRELARSRLHSDASRLKEFHPSPLLQFVQQNDVPIFLTRACPLGGEKFITDFFAGLSFSLVRI